MKTLITSAFVVSILFLSCKEENVPEPQVNYRIKEILRQEGGKDYSKTLFTYEGDKLVKKELIPLQPIEDLAYTQTFSYSGNRVTRVMEGMVKTKTILEIEGTKMISEEEYYSEGGDFILISRDNFHYMNGELQSIFTTNYSSLDSTKYYMDYIYSDDKIAEAISGGYDEDGNKILGDKRQFIYENGKLSAVMFFQLNDLDLKLFGKIDYKYVGDKVVSKFYYTTHGTDVMDLHSGRYYDYDVNGYLEKDYYDYTETYYTYEKGNGNASIVDNQFFFMEDFDPTPFYKSGNLNQNPQSDLSQQIIQQILQSQMGK